MRLGIIGLPQAGKTTVFNALTRGDRPTGTLAGGGRFEVQTAVVAVPDPRVDRLSAMFRPRKTVYAQVTVVDIGGVEGAAEAKAGFSGPLLNQLTQLDGFLHVVRAFEDPTLPHPAGRVDPGRDLESVDGEFQLNDLLAVERKLERLQEDAKKGAVKDKALAQREQALFARLHAALSADQPLRDVELTPEDEKLLSGYGLLTLKPALVIVNVGEQAPAVELATPHRRAAVVSLQGKLEMELAQLPADEAGAFLDEYGIDEPGLNRVIRESYRLLGLQSFFTVGEDEVRAWTVRRGATAPEAAGVIHTDFQKGFIRAEAIGYDELVALGGLAEAKAKGKLRLEGKEYVVQDGDVLNIRFSR